MGRSHGLGLEFPRLGYQLVHAVVGGQHIGFVQVGVLLDDLQGLGADGTGGAEYGYLFLHIYLFILYKNVL